MKILVQTLTGKKFNLDVEPNDTIEIVKEKIQDKEGYPPDQMILRKSSNHLILEDNRTLEDYNFKEGDIIIFQLKIRGCSLRTTYISVNGNITEIGLCICGNVRHIKEQIEKAVKIKPEFQQLTLNGKILDDDNTKTASVITKSFLVLEVTNLENNNNLDFKEKYKNQLEQLKNLGYNDETINLQALKLNNGILQNAIELLVNMYN